MNKNNKLPTDLPATEHDFQLDVVGSVTKKRFIGDFTCRIPTIKDQCSISKYKAFLDGDHPQHLEPGTMRIHKMISYLKYTLVGEFPKFWKDSEFGYDLRDINVISELYEKVLDFENKWIEELWGVEKEEEVLSDKD